MKSINPKNDYVPLRINLSLRRDTLRLISEMAYDMGISIDEVLSFLAEDSVIDLEIDEDLRGIKIPSSCSLQELKEIIEKRKFS
tara:strand:+ start:1107 stop:1358 length:252 start_codon:yes stop_codon:yes gene_type:complete